MAQEFELKFAASPQAREAIQREFGPGRIITMETTYYDTPQGDLSRGRMTLRRRLENGVSVCALKTPGEQGVRGEWEYPCQDIFQALEALFPPQKAAYLQTRGLVPLCGARFTRWATLICQPDFTAELAVDSGLLLGGGRELPLEEVELELKSGNRQALEAYGLTFARQFRLETEPASKFRRALALAKGE